MVVANFFSFCLQNIDYGFFEKSSRTVTRFHLACDHLLCFGVGGGGIAEGGRLTFSI